VLPAHSSLASLLMRIDDLAWAQMILQSRLCKIITGL
jgi:hypothetical protein